MSANLQPSDGNRKIAIVGAGISGLCLAVLLKNRGQQVTLFERYPAVKAVGAGMTLWPNATRVLQHLEVLSEILPQGLALDQLDVRLSTGERLMQIPTEQFQTPAIAVHRAALHQALMNKLGNADLRLNHECLGVVQDQQGTRLQFAHGESEAFDVIVGADGIHSEVRKFVQPHRELDYKGYVVWRGIAKVQEHVLQPGFFSETWGAGHRFGILPMGQQQVCWYATANWNRDTGPAPSSRLANLKKMFEGWHEPVPQVLENTIEESIIQNQALDCKPQPGWSRGSVVLMGDSVHPTAPNLGQGACMSIEDAMALGQLLLQNLPLTETFARYEKSRFRRVSGVTRRAAWIGGIGQWQNPVVRPVRDFVCGFIPGYSFTLSSRSIHAYKADADFSA